MSEPKLKHANLPEGATDLTEFLNAIVPLADMTSEDDIHAVADWIRANADRLNAIFHENRANRKRQAN